MSQKELPIKIDLGDIDPDEFCVYYQSNRAELEERLYEAGAIKFSGVRIGGAENFTKILKSTGEEFLSYVAGNSPRKKMSDFIYTSTEYDKSQKITMHNELSYARSWPKKLYFFCLIPAESDGETLIADSREILKKMDKEIVNEIEKKGVQYIRNLHGGRGFGRSWQETFETNEKAELENHCDRLGIKRAWKPDGSITIVEERKGIVEHWKTGEKVWFNQIDQFHPYQLGADIYEAFRFGYDSFMEYPIYVTYGDGQIIPDEVIAEVMRTIESVTLAPKWQKNELLILDNELAAHGRNSFTGNRTVLVGMSA